MHLGRRDDEVPQDIDETCGTTVLAHAQGQAQDRAFGCLELRRRRRPCRIGRRSSATSLPARPGRLQKFAAPRRGGTPRPTGPIARGRRPCLVPFGLEGDRAGAWTISPSGVPLELQDAQPVGKDGFETCGEDFARHGLVQHDLQELAVGFDSGGQGRGERQAQPRIEAAAEFERQCGSPQCPLPGAGEIQVREESQIAGLAEEDSNSLGLFHR